MGASECAIKELLDLCYEGEAEKVIQVINENPKMINSFDDELFTPLMKSLCGENDWELTRWLINHPNLVHYSTDIYENSFMLNNSEIIYANNSIYFSNNENEFFSIDAKTGVVKWKQTINSNLTPLFIDNLLFTITLEGYLTILDPRNGNIVRMTNIFNKIKKAKKKQIYPTGFVAGKNKIYTSLSNGELIIIDIL